MTRRLIFPLLLGLVGAAVLAGLGTWQVQRLAWKEAILADIAHRLDGPAVDLPAAPDRARDIYRAVRLTGRLDGRELHVLTTRKPDGPGFRIIQALTTADGRRLLADLGSVPEVEKDSARTATDVAVLGNLVWPDETDGFTPAPDRAKNIWFARDVALMAEALGTEPVMVALRSSDPPLAPRPWPVSVNIPNDHLQYAITWFSLMVIWIVMTGYLIWRIKRGDA